MTALSSHSLVWYGRVAMPFGSMKLGRGMKMPSRLEVANDLRKKITAASKKLDKLHVDRKKMEDELINLEQICRHQWGTPFEDKKRKGMFLRVCTDCGKTEASKDVRVKF